MKQQTASSPSQKTELYRRILGVNFFVGDAPAAVRIGREGGLVVAPSAPGLVDLGRDREYRRALLGADLALTDSGLLVLLWNAMTFDRINRVSGLEYLRLLLANPEFYEPRAVFWVMPSEDAMRRNLRWLKANGYPTEANDCYVAPRYPKGPVSDERLVGLINERNPRHVIIGVGGGVQEKLGLYLKSQCAGRPAFHCIGAAIGFLTGDQVRIPDWADQKLLGWLFRCVSDPRRFVPRYARALELPLILWRYRTRMPNAQSNN